MAATVHHPHHHPVGGLARRETGTTGAHRRQGHHLTGIDTGPRVLLLLPVIGRSGTKAPTLHRDQDPIHQVARREKALHPRGQKLLLLASMNLLLLLPVEGLTARRRPGVITNTRSPVGTTIQWIRDIQIITAVTTTAEILLLLMVMKEEEGTTIEAGLSSDVASTTEDGAEDDLSKEGEATTTTTATTIPIPRKTDEAGEKTTVITSTTTIIPKGADTTQTTRKTAAWTGEAGSEAGKDLPENPASLLIIPQSPTTELPIMITMKEVTEREKEETEVRRTGLRA